MEMDNITKALHIRYLKLKLLLETSRKCIFPKHKVSAIRGGMGEILMQEHCIGDRVCDTCGFLKECMVQHIMYSKYDLIPFFASDGDSIGYVLECHNTEKSFQKGEQIKLNLLLFGDTIVYVREILNAIRKLGIYGVGNHYAPYTVVSISDDEGTEFLENGQLEVSRITPSYVDTYVQERITGFQEASKIKIAMNSPVTIKFHQEFLQKFDMEAMVRAIKRRIYMLDCYEGIEALEYYKEKTVTVPILYQECYNKTVPRYSNRKKQKVFLRGLMGKIELDNPGLEVLMLLLAGELIHVGKNTSFGFGGYKLQTG